MTMAGRLEQESLRHGCLTKFLFLDFWRPGGGGLEFHPWLAFLSFLS